MSVFSVLGAVTRTALRPLGFKFDTRYVDGVPVLLWQRRLARAHAAERTIVMVPGFGDSPLSWVPLVTTLLARRSLHALGLTRLVLIELPGGLGVKHAREGIRSAKQLFSVVRDVVTELRPTFLVGQSMGGYLVAHYAVHQQPTWLQKIAIMCPSGLGLEGTDKGKWANVLSDIAEGRPDTFVHNAVNGLKSNPLLSLPARAFGNELRGYLLREDVRAHMQSYLPEDLVDEHLHRMPYPTLLLWGTADTLVPYFLFDEWKARLDKAPRAAANRYVSVQNVSHGVHVEAAPRVADELVAFFGS